MGIAYKISAKGSFIDSLSLGILHNLEYSTVSNKILIILPNQTSCKLLYNSFLRQCNNSFIIPKIIPLSDLSNADDPFKFFPEFLSMPASI